MNDFIEGYRGVNTYSPSPLAGEASLVMITFAYGESPSYQIQHRRTKLYLDYKDTWSVNGRSFDNRAKAMMKLMELENERETV